MVKISDIASVDQISAATGTKASTPEGAMSFSDVLRNAVQEIDGPAENTNIQATQTNAASMVEEAGLSDSALSVMDQTNALLEALENFAGRLAGQTNTLKQIDPEVSRIEEMAGELEQSLAGFEGLDDELAGLVQQVVTQSKVEVMKFQRGDYV